MGRGAFLDLEDLFWDKPTSCSWSLHALKPEH